MKPLKWYGWLILLVLYKTLKYIVELYNSLHKTGETIWLTYTKPLVWLYEMADLFDSFVQTIEMMWLAYGWLIW